MIALPPSIIPPLFGSMLSLAMPTLPVSIVRVAARVAALVLVTATALAQPATPPRPVNRRPTTLSIVGTTDLHGFALPDRARGGLALLGGYLRNLRAVRSDDGGAVLLLDAGDTFQGGIPSNLSEGALVVDAYNALGYDALAIGNHEFEYGPVDTWNGESEPTDMRGALKAAAARARFPFLGANLIDDATGRPVTWPNVSPSTMVETAGLRVGIVGVMTADGLTMTLAANVQGLSTTALAPSVEGEARQLREHGADVVVVLAHAGGRCELFDDPSDLSSCDDDAEIFRLARRLPPGLVDAIVAGHSHAGLAHEVAGIPIIQAFSQGAAFARVDLTVQPGAGVVSTQIFPPQALCAGFAPDGSCLEGGAAPAPYEGAPVVPHPSVAAAMQPELDRVRAWRAAELGVVIATPLTRLPDSLDSSLANLFADALRTAGPGADVAIGLGARRGGLRTDVPAGPLTRGTLYDVFPFDNRVVTLMLTGEQLREILAGEVAPGFRGVPGVSGVRVGVTCVGEMPEVAIARDSGAPIRPDETLVVATTDFMAARAAVRSAAMPIAEWAVAPLVRDAAATWLIARGGRLHAADLTTPARWALTDGTECPQSLGR